VASTGITVRIDTAGAQRSLERLMSNVKDQRAAWEDIGFALERSVDKNFDEEGRPKWAAWNPDYAASRSAGDKIGTDSGQLRRSVSHEADAEGVTIGTNLEYAAIFQFGGKTKPHEIKARFAKVLRFLVGGQVVFRQRVMHPGSRHPARPFLKLQEEDYETMARILEEHIVEGW
jgi:phage virion morphogenesis protein